MITALIYQGMNTEQFEIDLLKCKNSNEKGDLLEKYTLDYLRRNGWNVFQTRARNEITNGIIGDTGIDIMGNKIINQQNYIIVVQCKNYISNNSSITLDILEKLHKRTLDFPTAIGVLMCYNKNRLNVEARNYLKNHQSKLMLIDLYTINNFNEKIINQFQMEKQTQSIDSCIRIGKIGKLHKIGNIEIEAENVENLEIYTRKDTTSEDAI
jgi:hypothetical protein